MGVYRESINRSQFSQRDELHTLLTLIVPIRAFGAMMNMSFFHLIDVPYFLDPYIVGWGIRL